MRGLLFVTLIAHSTLSTSLFSAQRIINGDPVVAGQYTEVVRQTNPSGSNCTATIIGPKAILTAAHCASNNANVTFKVGNNNYTAKIIRSSKWPAEQHDIAVGIVSQEITGVTPATIGGTASIGLNITLLGYGCTTPGGPGGELRVKDSTITIMPPEDIPSGMISKKDNGGVLCLGDSGGPAYTTVNQKKVLIGVHSKGDSVDTNVHIRTDHQDTKDFLSKTASDNGIEICGINKNCDGGAVVTPATCTLTASPDVIKIGNQLNLILATKGDVASATIDGVNFTPATGGTKVVTPTQIGTFSSVAQVTGKDGKTSNCSATYKVEDKDPVPTKPTCQLVADPDFIELGKTLTLRMTIQGNATSAQIEGTNVSLNNPNLSIKPTLKGNFSATGVVSNAQGSNSCTATYTVGEGGDPTTPTFAVVPTYCGDNKFPGSGVSKVCIAVINRDASITDLKVSYALQVTYVDQTKEVFPIIARKARPSDGGSRIQEDIYSYANDTKSVSGHLVLRTGKATLTKTVQGSSEVPVAIEGQTGAFNDRYYMVDTLLPARSRN